MMNQTEQKQQVKINWEEYLKESVQKTMRGYPESAKKYPGTVEIDSHNNDGTITVITGYNDFGTPMVVRVDPTSKFVSPVMTPEDKNHAPCEIDEENINGTYEETMCVIHLMSKKGYDVAYGNHNWEFDDDFDKSQFEKDLTECCEQIHI